MSVNLKETDPLRLRLKCSGQVLLEYGNLSEDLAHYFLSLSRRPASSV